MNQEERKTAIRRMRVLVAAACILMLLYGLRLIFLQLVNGDDFKSQATNTTDYKFTVTAARGDIVDSRGERIATSVTGYNVVLNKLLMGDEDLDGMLQKIVELLRANGESWNDTLLISQPDAAGNYTFTAEEGSTRDQKALAAMKDNLGLQQYATANDVMEKLVEDYDLASYPLSWQRTLGGIHYEMQLQAFSNVNNFIMAENVSEATVATIKEHSLSLPGVEIVETSTRSYEQSTVLPHVLGRVGKITAEKWKVTDENGQTTYPLREKGYNMNDIIGISGLESAYEDELRGKDGVETITRNSDGVIVDTALTTVPEPGHTVQLTIDSRFQKAVDKALAENIDMINRVYNTGSMKAAAGAAVVLDVKDGSVLAASNYPSFDQNLYATQYSEYSADESLPLFNRALQGLYTPGSTFKPAVAVAAVPLAHHPHRHRESDDLRPVGPGGGQPAWGPVVQGQRPGWLADEHLHPHHGRRRHHREADRFERGGVPRHRGRDEGDRRHRGVAGDVLGRHDQRRPRHPDRRRGRRRRPHRLTRGVRPTPRKGGC